MLLRALIFALVAALGSCSPAPLLEKRQSNFDAFVASERAISLQGALANIGGLGSNLVPGAAPGIVVASPSTVNPDYFYTWTRDSALTYAMIIDEFELGRSNLSDTIADYIRAQGYLQTVTNPSGTLWPAGEGLGEPKYYVNRTRFNAVWGRPQRDGPALRAIALMMYANFRIAQNRSNIAMVENGLWPVVLNDLRYVGQYWNQTGYDLWEEVHGSSFFTINAQHRALVMGSYLARNLSTTCRPCEQAAQIQCFLQNNFWNATGRYIIGDINTNDNSRSGIGTNPILSSIQVFDINAPCNASDYQPCNSRMLSTHKVVVDSFRNLYPVNRNASAPEAILVGRYPEDTYYGGNPWPLCTFACAEMLYDAIAQFARAGSLTIDSTSLPFFVDIYPSALQTTYTGDEMNDILAAMTTYANGFMRVVQPYLPANGSISEQFNSSTGESLSASKLTWSFAAFITAAQRRAAQYPVSWGAGRSLANARQNGTCQATSYNSTGSYMPATNIGSPNISMACATRVVFTANITTSFGTNAFLVGNTTLLGGSLNNASAVILPCNAGNYTSARSEWYVDIWLPAGQPVQYQWVRQEGNGTFTFENSTRTVNPANCGNSSVVRTDDAPRFPS